MEEQSIRIRANGWLVYGRGVGLIKKYKIQVGVCNSIFGLWRTEGERCYSGEVPLSKKKWFKSSCYWGRFIFGLFCQKSSIEIKKYDVFVYILQWKIMFSAQKK